MSKQYVVRWSESFCHEVDEKQIDDWLKMAKDYWPNRTFDFKEAAHLTAKDDPTYTESETYNNSVTIEEVSQ
jgi:hypothetical protein